MIRDSDSPTGARQKLVFEYDHQGRRIRKQYFSYSGGWQEQTDTIFLYDGWNLVAELNANASNAQLRTYVWGSDLSGSMQGAGGVGGLLKPTYYGTSTTNAFVAYDANGNVTALIDAANGNVCARYEYGPFAEPIRSSGPLSKPNPIRFSSKYTDNESGFLYYGYRYYNPSTGQWPNRDPIGERGGENVYGFVQNEAIRTYDVDGRERGSICPICGHYYVGECPRDGYPNRRDPPSLTQGNSCARFPDVIRAIQVANAALKSGECAKWFTDRGSRGGDNYVVNCYGKCKLPCLFGGTAWTYPALARIGLCPDNLAGFGPSGIASLLIHELGHHYSLPVPLLSERWANEAIDACAPFLTN